MDIFTNKAQKKVDKAVIVFDQAIDRLHEAQGILKDGLAKDAEKIESTKVLIKQLEDKLLVIEQDKQEKIDTINHNHKLITKMDEFR